MTIANLDKRLALTEQKLDTVIDDIAEIKSDMKQHIDSTTSATEKIRSRIDYIIWSILVGSIAIIVNHWIK
jgi:hypothetical protein